MQDPVQVVGNVIGQLARVQVHHCLRIDSLQFMENDSEDGREAFDDRVETPGESVLVSDRPSQQRKGQHKPQTHYLPDLCL